VGIKAQNLTRIFNAFARKAVKDFPELKEKFVIYSYTTGAWHGSRASMAGTDKIIDKAEDKKEENSGTIAYAEKTSRHSLIVYLNPDSRYMTAAGQTHKKEINGILEHELAHLVAPAAYDETFGENFRECVADVFSFIRRKQDGEDIERALDATIWMRAVGLVLEKESVHFTMPALMGLKSFLKRNDVSGLTPVETANLAYRISYQDAYTPAQIRAIKKAFAPVQATYKKNAEADLEQTWRIMRGHHGKHSKVIYQTGLVFLQPYLDTEVGILATEMPRAEAKAQKFGGKFWREVRKKIKVRGKREKAKTNRTDAFNRQLDDLELLGRFDKKPKAPIDPDVYDSAANRKHLEQARKKHAASL